MHFSYNNTQSIQKAHYMGGCGYIWTYKRVPKVKHFYISICNVMQYHEEICCFDIFFLSLRIKYTISYLTHPFSK